MIHIGPAGTGGKDPENLIKIKEYGFSAVEVAFTYGIWMSNSDASKYKEVNKKLGLKLSIHAPYYINLNSKEKSKNTINFRRQIISHSQRIRKNLKRFLAKRWQFISNHRNTRRSTIRIHR